MFDKSQESAGTSETHCLAGNRSQNPTGGEIIGWQMSESMLQ